MHSDHASVVPVMCMSQPLSIEDIRKASEQIHELPLEEQDIKDVAEALLGDSKAEGRGEDPGFGRRGTGKQRRRRL